MTPTDDDGRAVLLTLGPLLPARLVAALARGITAATAAYGWRDVKLCPGRLVTGVPAEPGADSTMHVIVVESSPWHTDMTTWSCSCGTDDDRSHADTGRAVGAALNHVPAGHWWSVEPDARLIGNPTHPSPRLLPGLDDLPVARGRREGLAAARAALTTELRGAPHNAPARAQITYVGGLARARRLVETLYQEASVAEENLVLGPPEPRS